MVERTKLTLEHLILILVEIRVFFQLIIMELFCVDDPLDHSCGYRKRSHTDCRPSRSLLRMQGLPCSVFLYVYPIHRSIRRSQLVTRLPAGASFSVYPTLLQLSTIVSAVMYVWESQESKESLFLSGSRPEVP